LQDLAIAEEDPDRIKVFEIVHGIAF